METRVLDENFVLIAELYRSRGELKTSVDVTQRALGEKPITPAEIFSIVQNPTQAIVLGELARIKTDSAVSLANRNFWAPRVLSYLGTAVNTINEIYKHPAVNRALGYVRQPQNFLVEMDRDEAKTFRSLAQFYDAEKKQLVEQYGDDKLKDAKDRLRRDDPLRSLLVVE